MKYYIATSTENISSHNLVRDLLKEFGHEIAYDWTAHGSVRQTSLARLREVAHAEFQGILNADFVLALLPAGKGTHTELGFSIANGKRVFLHSEDSSMFDLGPQACVFYHHAEVIRLSCPIQDVAQTIQHLLVN